MSVKKLSNGKYRTDVYDINNRRIIRVFNRKKDAVEFEIKIKNEKYNQKLTSLGMRKAKVLFDDILDEYLATKSHLRPGSVQRYTSVVNQFRAFLKERGIKYLHEFTPNDASELYKRLISPRKDPTGNTDKILKAKPKTVNFYLQVFRAIFDQEVRKENLTRNPMSHIKNLKVEKKRPDYYTEEELKEFFKQKMHIKHRYIFLVLLNTGLRFQELANITWNDVDIEARTITIRPKDGFNTKTFESQRKIPMNSVVYDIVSKLAESKESEYVFTSSKGEKITERRLLRVCKRIANDAGIKSRAYLHKFRHTFATHLVQKGVGIEKIQKLLGHSSIEETLIYAHVRPDNLHDDVERLTVLINNSFDKEE